MGADLFLAMEWLEGMTLAQRLSKKGLTIEESVALIQQHWVDCLAKGREPATSGRDNLQTLALVEAVYRSAATGRTVALSELLG